MMENDWFTRLSALIEADGRDKKAISLKAGLGQNFLQQMLKDKKRPNIENFMKIIDVLGHTNAIYVLTGIKIDPRDLEFLNFFVTISEKKREAILELLHGKDDEAA